MKYLFLFLLLLSLLLGDQLTGQDVHYELDNPHFTNGGMTYEVDVMISSSAGFKLGSGQLYFNFNRQAFGENVAANRKITIDRPSGSILSEKVSGIFDYYKDFIVNDNTTSRVSFAWQHAFSAGCLPANNVTATPTLLFRIIIDFAPGGAGIAPDVCFESADIFTAQTFTACGPGNCSNADCQNNPGVQLVNDTYACLSGGLPVELLQFKARARGKAADLQWQTGQEIGSSHFEVERSLNGRHWETIGQRTAAGESRSLRNYAYIDQDFHLVASPESPLLYRLRLVDLDGSFSYSNIEALGTEQAVGNLRLYPNPATDRAYLVLDQPHGTGVTVSLHDATGKLVHQQDWKEEVPRQIPLNFGTAKYPPGVYIVRMTPHNGQPASVERLVIAE